MGWTYMEKPKGQSIIDTLKKEFDGTSRDGKTTWKIIDGAMVGKVAYLAERRTEGGKSEIYCNVVLTDMINDRCNFGYKAISEECEPYYYDCPERILRQLTPAENVWRSTCWKLINEKAKKAQPEPKQAQLELAI